MGWKRNGILNSEWNCNSFLFHPTRNPPSTPCVRLVCWFSLFINESHKCRCYNDFYFFLSCPSSAAHRLYACDPAKTSCRSCLKTHRCMIVNSCVLKLPRAINSQVRGLGPLALRGQAMPLQRALELLALSLPGSSSAVGITGFFGSTTSASSNV